MGTYGMNQAFLGRRLIPDYLCVTERAMSVPPQPQKWRLAQELPERPDLGNTDVIQTCCFHKSKI
jgi:hypothetical protein